MEEALDLSFDRLLMMMRSTYFQAVFKSSFICLHPLAIALLPTVCNETMIVKKVNFILKFVMNAQRAKRAMALVTHNLGARNG